MVAWWRLVFSPEPAPIHRRIEAPEQFDRDTRLLVLDQSRRSANPLGMLWPEMDAAFVTSGCKWRPRRVVIVAQMAIAVPSARRRRKKREGATSDRKGGV
jgi:hypothetical protein